MTSLYTTRPDNLSAREMHITIEGTSQMTHMQRAVWLSLPLLHKPACANMLYRNTGRVAVKSEAQHGGQHR